MTPARPRPDAGFTLLETVAVIMAGGLLASLVFMATHQRMQRSVDPLIVMAEERAMDSQLAQITAEYRRLLLGSGMSDRGSMDAAAFAGFEAYVETPGNFAATGDFVVTAETGVVAALTGAGALGPVVTQVPILRVTLKSPTGERRLRALFTR